MGREELGEFKYLVDMLEELFGFRRAYEIPNDVGVSYCPESEVDFVKGEGKVVIPLVAFVEGEVKIPMSNLLTNFLRHFNVCPDQCTPYTFRVVSSVAKLNRRLYLNLTEHDINYVYSF